MRPLEHFGQYQIEVFLGSGRFTDAYRAIDTVRHHTVALKVLKTSALPAEIQIQRLLEIVSQASELVHPRVAWVWETGMEDSLPCLAERFVDGPSLAQTLAKSGSLTWETGLQIITQVAQGLDYAHKMGWLHAGIKPKNILISQDSGAVITDIGLCHAFHTLGFANVCSAAYTPPEVWQGEPQGPPADLYALACVFYEILTGKILFNGSSREEIRAAHLNPPPLVQTWPADAPWEALPVFVSALASDPAERFASAEDFVDAIEDALNAAIVRPQERLQHQEQLRAWRETQERVRLEAEEADRAAALEKARLEIHERARLETQAAFSQTTREPPPQESLALSGQANLNESSPSVPVSRRNTLIFWVAVSFLIVVVLGVWLFGNLIAGWTPTLTSTPTAPRHSMTLIPTGTPSPAPSETFTHTPAPPASKTPTNTASKTPSNTPSSTPTASITPTFTLTWTLTVSPTPSPNQNDRERSIRALRSTD